ncbi:3-phosphoglycerate dehydrogenase [Alkalitalea saponilacus]|uniref:D-3-phosphoglycerate dehydrogenase n=1 Tax=Alkalitalea saponilacus TaxID=889453 RepID=A0A1T5HAK2_9BACT|nr:3-phosphoglycerate dehydrogenase [Alkalitalea saponilacus]ASB50795.1 3-phosphoglycerate dehydrogenase [Alkalitalea saponilacus]SKC17718.1 D-3-phosphoglycerate dehydrogenase [Alkalitalea saponilacus]
MKKVLVATEKPFSQIAIDEIKIVLDGAGFQLELLEKYTDKSQLLSAVADVDAMIVRSDKVTTEVLDAAKNLKIVVRAGAGYDNLDLDACTQREVVAMNTPGQNSNAVAELVFGMMIYGMRKQFSGGVGSELRGKSIGIHAYGNVGYYVGKIAHGFDMKVYGYDPYVSADRMQAHGVEPLASVEELYRTCEFISLHIPANDFTKKSINKAILSMMPQGAVLVNTARKEVIDEDGMIELMDERPDFMYLSDITPDKAEEFQKRFPGRYFFTPKKMGAQTEEANVNAGVAAARQIVSYLTSGDETFRVNR